MLFGGIGREILRFTGYMADALKQGRPGVGEHLDPNDPAQQSTHAGQYVEARQA
jgi:hypothetical protein